MTLSEDTSYQIVGAHQHDEQRDPEARHQWDINDNILPTPPELEEYNEWPNGHCRAVYTETSEDARRHCSGWAMRNTNNHNVNILKKSCLGVLVCNMACVSEKGDRIHLRPAICDKARKKQIGRQCSNPRCPGKLELQPCRGHCGYPVTHFWRHTNGAIYFQAKGVHDHPYPEIKASAEARRHATSSKENKFKLSDVKRTSRKRMWFDQDTLSRLYKVPKLEKSGNDVICSCPPFECLCSSYQLPPQNGPLPMPVPQVVARQKQLYDGEFHSIIKEEPRLPTQFDFKQERQSPEHHMLLGFEPPVSVMNNMFFSDRKDSIPNSQPSYPTTCQTDCMFLESLPVDVTSANLTSANTNMMHCADLTRDLSSSPRDFVDGPMPVSIADNTVSSMTQEFYSAKMSTNISHIDNAERKIDSQKTFGNLLSQSDASVLDLNLPSITAFFSDENIHADKPLDDSFHKEKRADNLSYDCMDQKTPQLSPISDHRASPNSHPGSPVSLTELKPMNNSEAKFTNIHKFQSSYHNDIGPVPHDTVDSFNFPRRAFQPYVADCYGMPYPTPNYYGELKQELVRPHPVPSLNSNPYYANPDLYPSPANSIAQRLPSIVPQTANINISFAYQ
ncbi:uncharacterized protein LOC135486575 [Lineus longissimus]|uniref:uncharacterized protein LOC135486575 n=1 Tax=Lineus longissimus TaxID=88925 RepID=UPI00315CCE22